MILKGWPKIGKAWGFEDEDRRTIRAMAKQYGMPYFRLENGWPAIDSEVLRRWWGEVSKELYSEDVHA